MTAALPLCALLALAAPAAAAGPATDGSLPPPVTSVALDLTGLDEEAYRRVGALALERQVVLRLVQESFAVVAPTAVSPGPDVLLRVGALESGGLRLVATSRAGSEEREVAFAGGEPVEELHLEVAQKLVELARALAPPPPPPPAPSPVERDAPQPAPGPAVPAERAWRVDAIAGGEVVFRKGGNDPQARLGVRIGERLGAAIAGTLAPSRTSQIRVLEWTVLVGPTWRQPLVGALLEVEVGAGAGVALHHYTLRSRYASGRDDAGTRLDFAAALPVSLSLRPIPQMAIALRVAGRFAGRGREHVFSDEVIWSRRPWGLEVGGTVAARF